MKKNNFYTKNQKIYSLLILLFATLLLLSGCGDGTALGPLEDSGYDDPTGRGGGLGPGRSEPVGQAPANTPGFIPQSPEQTEDKDPIDDAKSELDEDEVDESTGKFSVPKNVPTPTPKGSDALDKSSSRSFFKIAPMRQIRFRQKRSSDDNTRVLVIGPESVGKSAIINTLYSALRGSEPRFITQVYDGEDFYPLEGQLEGLRMSKGEKRYRRIDECFDARVKNRFVFIDTPGLKRIAAYSSKEAIDYDEDFRNKGAYESINSYTSNDNPIDYLLLVENDHMDAWKKNLSSFAIECIKSWVNPRDQDKIFVVLNRLSIPEDAASRSRNFEDIFPNIPTQNFFAIDPANHQALYSGDEFDDEEDRQLAIEIYKQALEQSRALLAKMKKNT